MNPKAVFKRFEKAKANKQLWESLFRECYEFALPERNTIDHYMQGQRKNNRLFDNTAGDALEDQSNKLAAILMPINSQWAKLESGTEIPKDEQQELDELLENVTSILFDHLNSSNLISQATASFLDLGISTGTIVVEEGNGIQSSLNFRSISLSEVYLEQSSRSIPETIFRQFEVPIEDITYTWNKAKLNSELKKILSEDPTTKVELIEGVILKSPGKYMSFLMYDKKFLYEQDIDYNPFISFRASIIPGEVYGRGTVMRQLSNIKTLNAMVHDSLKSTAMVVNPIITATDDGGINPYAMELKPGILPVDSNDASNPTLRPLQVGGNIPLALEIIKSYQEAIKAAFMSQPFGSVESTPVRSATEMSIRNNEFAQKQLSFMSRIQAELLERLLNNSLNILSDAGKLPKLEVNGQQIKIKFVNPATRQQDEGEIASFARFGELTANTPPDLIAMKIKVEDIPVQIYDLLGLPASLKRDEKDVEKAKNHVIATQASQQEQQNV